MRFVKVILIVIFFFVSMLFFVQNKEVLTQAFVLSLDVPGLPTLHSVPVALYVLVLCAFLAGGLLCTAWFFLDKIRQNRQMREYQNRLVGLERELNTLRTMPLENASYPAGGEAGPES